uniref:Uncharacterized protein n=1 Tax=Glossina austeni TaxID=7395 RepID=A0A1A9UT55_GLOAU
MSAQQNFVKENTENFKRTVHWCIDKCEHNKYSCMERGHGRANGVPPCHTTGTTTVQPSPSPSVLPSSVIAEAALETFSSQAGTAIRRNNSGAGSLNSVTSHTHAAFTSKTDHGQRTSLASICKISHDNEQTTAAVTSHFNHHITSLLTDSAKCDVPLVRQSTNVKFVFDTLFSKSDYVLRRGERCETQCYRTSNVVGIEVKL